MSQLGENQGAIHVKFKTQIGKKPFSFGPIFIKKTTPVRSPSRSAPDVRRGVQKSLRLRGWITGLLLVYCKGVVWVGLVGFNHVGGHFLDDFRVLVSDVLCFAEVIF